MNYDLMKTRRNAGYRSCVVAKGCMAVPWGHLLDDTKLFAFRGYVLCLSDFPMEHGMNLLIKRKSVSF